jgi:serine protease Do
MKSFRLSVVVAACSVMALAGGFFGGSSLFQKMEYARAAQDVETNRADLQQAEDLSSVFRHVGKVVGPSVVSINVHKTIKNAAPPDDLRRFFQGIPGMPPDGPGGAPDGNGNLEEEGTGSGVVMEVDGSTAYILTNNHVAGDADSIEITLADGRQIKNGKLLGADAKSDLAVVKIEADGLIAAKWGDSGQLEKGDWILAFGSPFGYVGSMTHGIVSALDRNDVGLLGKQGYEDFIQVDAPINPGNSGGPLVNLHGEVVGINTAIASQDGGFQGIGFAIPSNAAKWVYTELKANGKVTRGWLGVGIGDVAVPENLKTAKTFGYTGSTGVLVQQIFSNTPASDKLKEGDIITALNGKTLDTSLDLRNTIAKIAPGTEVTLTVFRDGKSQDVKLTLGTQPEDVLAAAGQNENPAPAPANPGASVASIGITVQTMTPQLATKYGQAVPRRGNGGGAIVTAVTKNSLAATAGLEEGDLITQVASTRVANQADAVRLINAGDLTKGIRLYVTKANGGGQMFVTIASEK